MFGHWKESGPWKVRKFCLPKPAQIQSNLCWTARLLLQDVWKIARFVAASLLLRYNTETCKVQLFCFACLPLFCWIFVTVVLRGSANSICDPSVRLVSKLCLNVFLKTNIYLNLATKSYLIVVRLRCFFGLVPSFHAWNTKPGTCRRKWVRVCMCGGVCLAHQLISVKTFFLLERCVQVALVMKQLACIVCHNPWWWVGLLVLWVQILLLSAVQCMKIFFISPPHPPFLSAAAADSFQTCPRSFHCQRQAILVMGTTALESKLLGVFTPSQPVRL